MEAAAATVPPSPAAALSCASQDACLVSHWTGSEKTELQKNLNTALLVQLPVESSKHQRWCNTWGGDTDASKPDCNYSA